MCINARADPNATHVPFRDSKLTRLLQASRQPWNAADWDANVVQPHHAYLSGAKGKHLIKPGPLPLPVFTAPVVPTRSLPLPPLNRTRWEAMPRPASWWRPVMLQSTLRRRSSRCSLACAPCACARRQAESISSPLSCASHMALRLACAENLNASRRARHPAPNCPGHIPALPKLCAWQAAGQQALLLHAVPSQ